MRYGHLETVNVILRTLSPVFIGSGQHFGKKEYILDVQRELISFPDLPKMTGYLKQRGLLSRYEAFLLNQREHDFQAFLNQNEVAPEEYNKFILYSIHAGEAIHNENFREVLTFIKDSAGHPYIPGSSLKGAIRTAIAAARLKEGNWSRDWRNIEQADEPNPRRYLKRETDMIERKIFFQLEHQDRNGNIINNPINDFMRGIRISDSVPIGFENLTLVGKYDRKPDGYVNSLPIFRECLAPGTEIKMTMTLDLPMLKKVGLDLDGIQKALHYFADQHYANFEQYFAELPEDADISTQQGVDIILGGGAGFISKTFIYNLAGSQSKALPQVAKIMTKQFPPQHQHSKDVAHYKVSPHMLKTACYQGSYYPLGRCELIIQS
jgi:CRISPR-associated protein Csm5